MAITSLRITNFRNLSEVEVVPESEGLNIIYGHNGSGKTSILEAIHYLGVGRSFRCSAFSRLIRQTTDKFSIFAQLLTDSKRCVPVGVERDARGGARLRVAGQEAASIAELAALLPIRVINSQSHHLLEAGPALRRKYLDWGLFYTSTAFLSCWRQFERALKQRNTVLREGRSAKELEVWTIELAKYAVEFDQLRRDYVAALTPILVSLANELVGLADLAIYYAPGWDHVSDYAMLLTSHYAEDRRVGYTQFGPHRADIDMVSRGVSVKHFLSRGQQKMLVCAMIIAQGILLRQTMNKSLVYLVDDLPSELDSRSTYKLISLLSGQQTQVFITAIEREAICVLADGLSDVAKKVFHVEQGCVSEQV